MAVVVRCFLVTAAGMRSIPICRPEPSYRFALRIVSCSRGSALREFTIVSVSL